MTHDEVMGVVRSALGRIAPEVDLARVRTDRDLRDELDIDSMDFLRFVVELHARLGVEVPEKDYPSIRTLDSCVAYLVERTGTAAGARPSPAG